jgi:type IV pilus assembly protein PilM
MIFKRSLPKVIGMDISGTSIKVVKLSKLDHSYQLDILGYEPLPPNLVQEHEIQNVEEMSNRIKNLITRLKLDKSQVAVAISGSAVITKVIEMNAGLSEHEQEIHIESVADQYIPFPLSEVALDYDVIGPVPNQPNKVEVLLVVARSELVDKYKAAIELAGLKLAYLDIETYALERGYHTLLHDQYLDRVVAIVNVGNLVTTLNVLVQGRTVYTREQAFGGKQLTEEIQAHYGLSFDEAEQKKRLHDLPADYDQEILTPFMQAIAQQIARSLQFYYSSGENRDIQQILLAGGSSNIAGLTEVIETELHLPVALMNPFSVMKISPEITAETLSACASSLTVACGLALRSFNG